MPSRITKYSKSRPDDKASCASMGIDVFIFSGKSKQGPNTVAGANGSTGHPFLSDNHVGTPSTCRFLVSFLPFCPRFRPLRSEIYPPSASQKSPSTSPYGETSTASFDSPDKLSTHKPGTFRGVYHKTVVSRILRSISVTPEYFSTTNSHDPLYLNSGSWPWRTIHP